jgi:hypothetical protein
MTVAVVATTTAVAAATTTAAMAIDGTIRRARLAAAAITIAVALTANPTTIVPRRFAVLVTVTAATIVAIAHLSITRLAMEALAI